MFFTTFGMFLIKTVNLNLNNRTGKKKKEKKETALWFPQYSFQDIEHLLSIAACRLQNYYIFENLIDIFIFLHFILLMLDGLFKHLFFSFH